LIELTMQSRAWLRAMQVGLVRFPVPSVFMVQVVAARPGAGQNVVLAAVYDVQGYT